MIIESVDSADPTMGALAARHMDTAFRRMMAGPRCVQTATYLRLVTGEPHPLGNLALVSAPDDFEATIEATVPLLDGRAPAAVIFTAGASAAVLDATKARGFGIEASMPAMAVDIDRMRPTALPSGYRFARISGGEDGRAWAEALALGYDLPRGLADLFAPDALGVDMAGDAPIQFFAVLHDGRQVATSLLFLADGLAGIYCVSTLVEERRRGLGAHATAEALRVAARLGYRVGVLQSSGAGHPVYLGLGFDDYASIPMLIHMPG